MATSGNILQEDVLAIQRCTEKNAFVSSSFGTLASCAIGAILFRRRKLTFASISPSNFFYLVIPSALAGMLGSQFSSAYLCRNELSRALYNAEKNRANAFKGEMTKPTPSPKHNLSSEDTFQHVERLQEENDIFQPQAETFHDPFEPVEPSSEEESFEYRRDADARRRAIRHTPSVKDAWDNESDQAFTENLQKDEFEDEFR